MERREKEEGSVCILGHLPRSAGSRENSHLRLIRSLGPLLGRLAIALASLRPVDEQNKDCHVRGPRSAGGGKGWKEGQ